jgi:hypothetical protein
VSTSSLLPPEQPGVVPAPKKSPIKPIIITIVSGVLLAAGSCMGFLSTFNVSRTNQISVVMAIGFLVGVAAVLCGAMWALVALIRFLFAGPEQ